MKTSETFKESYRIIDETFKIYRKINNLRSEYLNNQDECSHEIIFKYTDNHPRKMIIDGNYFCPACEKVIFCVHEEDINDTVFKNARIILLTNLSLIGTNQVHAIIKNEVYYNMDLYYNFDIDVKELSSKMEEKLINHQYDYNKTNKLVRKKV